MEDFEVEGLGEGVVRGAGLDPTELVDAVKLARRVVGSVHRLPSSNMPGDAFLARVGAEWRIYVRGKLPPRRLRFAILHECAEAVLDQQGYREGDVEAVADRLAACLGAPRSAALRACREHGPRWKQLALALAATESSAALRYGEATGAPLALVSPRVVRLRGDTEFVWPPEVELRSRPRPGLAKTRLQDDPRRFVLQPTASCEWEEPRLRLPRSF